MDGGIEVIKETMFSAQWEAFSFFWWFFFVYMFLQPLIVFGAVRIGMFLRTIAHEYNIRKHMDIETRDLFDKKVRTIEQLKKENIKLLGENNEMRSQLAIVRSAFNFDSLSIKKEKK